MDESTVSPTRPPAEDRLLTVPEVAERLSVGRLTVYTWIRNGDLRGVKLAKRAVRVRTSDLEAFLVDCAQAR